MLGRLQNTCLSSAGDADHLISQTRCTIILIILLLPFCLIHKLQSFVLCVLCAAMTLVLLELSLSQTLPVDSMSFLCNICSFLCLENRLKGKTVIGGSILAKVSVTSASFRTTFKRGALLLDEVLRSDSYLRKDRGPHTLIHILSLQCHITFSILCKTTSNGKNKVRKTALALV